MSIPIKSREILYQQHGVQYAGLLVWDGSIEGPRPGVLVCPTIRGRTGFEEGRARALAELGYAALVIDLYGVSTRDSTIDAYRGLMNALRNDRAALQTHLLAWTELCRAQDVVDPANIAAIGYCFGGLCALDLARTGVDIDGVVSFHGILQAPGNTDDQRIRSKVLVLHGWDDPLAPPDAVTTLAAELTVKEADWQIQAYGHTLHAFTNPEAHDSAAGTVYNPNAERRSWAAMQVFFAELFGG